MEIKTSKSIKKAILFAVVGVKREAKKISF